MHKTRLYAQNPDGTLWPSPLVLLNRTVKLGKNHTEVYCWINSPADLDKQLTEYGFVQSNLRKNTGVDKTLEFFVYKVRLRHISASH
jgi:hypothetical protein